MPTEEFDPDVKRVGLRTRAAAALLTRAWLFDAALQIMRPALHEQRVPLSLCHITPSALAQACVVLAGGVRIPPVTNWVRIPLVTEFGSHS